MLKYLIKYWEDQAISPNALKHKALTFSIPTCDWDGDQSINNDH